MKHSYKSSLKILTDFATAEGYSVSLDFKGISDISWNSRTVNTPKNIRIEGRYTLELKTYLMLHELGHHMLRRDWNKFGKTIPIVQQAESKAYDKDRRTLAYKVGCLEEEFKAWEAGLKLGIQLGIPIDLIVWNRFKTKCLMLYIKYFAGC